MALTLLEFDPFEDTLRDNPYPTYRRYREAGSVHPGRTGQPGRLGETWYVFDYRVCVEGLKSPQFGRAGLYDHQRANTTEPSVLDSILLIDPPDHTRLRRLVSLAFTPRAVERALPRLEVLAHEVVDELAGRPTWDVIGDFAFPFPVTVISDLLGVPIEDRRQIRQWSRALTAGIDVTQDPETYRQARDANQAFRIYLRDILRQRRTQPQDDLLTALIQAQEAGDRLSEDELITMVTLLVVAGHETTVNLIGNGLWALWQHPAQWDHVRSAGLTEIGVDELLRYDSSVQATSRLALSPVEMGDAVIPVGSVAIFLLGAANHDPTVFVDPDDLNLARMPNRHLAFGGGIHTCLGSALARAEGRVAINTLFRRYPHLHLQEDAPTWRPGLAFRGLESVQATT